ncbi:transposase [Geothermobacter ehrlichii]|uniref:transposase n=1 Tax=Geothermobacter ehrlichii TaxID=213224 RepID=UPI0011E7DEA0|nr:transposase [Geothermobacter ehrlichii]
MAQKKSNSKLVALESLIFQDRDLIRELVREAVQQVLDAELTEFLGAAPNERSADRRGDCAGCYTRSWATRVQSKLGASLQRMLQILQLNLFERCDLTSLFRPPDKKKLQEIQQLQLV